MAQQLPAACGGAGDTVPAEEHRPEKVPAGWEGLPSSGEHASRYSRLSASIGAIRAARRAGTQTAPREAMSTTSGTAR